MGDTGLVIPLRHAVFALDCCGLWGRVLVGVAKRNSTHCFTANAWAGGVWFQEQIVVAFVFSRKICKFI